jgi:hypothetical protein
MNKEELFNIQCNLQIIVCNYLVTTILITRFFSEIAIFNVFLYSYLYIFIFVTSVTKKILNNFILLEYKKKKI